MIQSSKPGMSATWMKIISKYISDWYKYDTAVSEEN